MSRGRSVRRIGGLALALLFLAGPALFTADLRAQEEGAGAVPDTARPDSVRFTLGEIRVETTRPTITGGGASSVMLNVDSVAVLPSPALSEVLDRMPLVRVRRNSRGQAQPSIRGMEERQIAVLVDGVPLTVGWDNRTDLSVVPLASASRVELVRGLSSVLAGPNVLGGVVKVGVSHGPFPDTLRHPLGLQASMDQHGAYALSGQYRRLWGDGGGRWFLRAGGGWRDSPGAALAEDLPGAARGDEGLLVNSDRQSTNGFLAMRYEGDGGEWLSLSTMAVRAERGVTPELHLIGGLEPEPRFWRIPEHWRSVTSISGGTGWGETGWGEGDLEATLGLDLQHLEIDAFESLAYRDSVGGETGDDRTLSFRLLADHTLGGGILTGALTLAETHHEQTLPDRTEDFEQRLWSVGLETEQPLAPGEGAAGPFEDPRLTLGASLDGASYPETGDKAARDPISGWGVRASGKASVADGRLEIHGGVSRKIRSPALRELFSGALGKFKPNHNLSPITLKVGEVGATAHLRGLELQAIVFQQRLEGSIVRAVVEEGVFQRQNRGETRATGVEVVANWTLGGASFRGDLTLQDVDLLDDEGAPTGEKAEYQPEIAVGMDASLPLPAGVSAEARLAHLGRQFGVNPRLGRAVELEPSTWLELGLRRHFAGGAGLPPFTAALRAENVTDEAFFDQLGLPRPGRTVRLQLRVF